MKLLNAIILALFFITLSGYTSNPYPVGYAKDAYWFCKFVGHNNQDIKLLGLSKVFMSPPDTEYDEIEKRFEGAVYDQLDGNFISDFPARCMDFESSRLAKKHHKRQKHTAKQSGYEVINIRFP